MKRPRSPTRLRAPRRLARLLATGMLAGLLAAAALPAPAGLWAHPALERERGGAGMRAPGPASSRRPPLAGRARKSYLPARAPESPGVGVSLFSGLLGFYRAVVSPVDGDRCVMAPTCSLYGHQAMAEYGVLLGVVLTADRLLHEADEIPRVPKIREGGETYYYDPLEANTYWLWEWLK